MPTQLQYGLGGDRPYGLYYQHSGQTPLPAILLAGAGGAIAGVVIAFLYALLVAAIPGSKLAFIAPIGFGAAVGAVTTLIARAGKVRSTAVVLAIVGVVTLVAYYAAWVFWIHAILDRWKVAGNFALPRLATRPDVMYNLARFFNHEGTFTMSRSNKDPVTGVFLLILWIAEFLSIFGFAFSVAVPLCKAQLFCEACRRWSGGPRALRTVEPGDLALLRQSLEAHDFTYLNALPPPQATAWWTVQLQTCPGCRQLNALSIAETRQTVNKKGKVAATKNKTLVDKLLIDAAEADALRGPAPAPLPSPYAATPVAPVMPPPPPGPPPLPPRPHA